MTALSGAIKQLPPQGISPAPARAAVCEGCHWLGLELDDTRNQNGAHRISTDTSRMSGWVIPTDEELMVARHTVSVLGLQNL